MRVLMVTTSFPRHEGDHAGHFVAGLAEHVVALGHDVTVLAPHEADLPREETIRGVRVHRFVYLPGWAEQVAYGSGVVVNLRRRPLARLGLGPFALALRRSLMRLGPRFDLVHVHWAPTAALTAPWRLKRPYVLTLHGSDVTLAHGGGIWYRLLRHALADAAGVDVVAEAQRRFLTANGLWQGDRPLAVIPAGVDEALFERPAISPPAGTFRFLYVGRLVESKGVLDLLAAFAEVRASGVDASLDFIGDGPLADRIRRASEEAGDDGRIRLLGRLAHDDALDEISAAGALVLPSHGEGSPLVVAEALALATPVIGTRVGALPELLGADGLLADAGDVTALTANLRRIATDPDLRARLATEGRARARERLAWSAIARDTVAFYRAALAAAGADGGTGTDGSAEALYGEHP